MSDEKKPAPEFTIIEVLANLDHGKVADRITEKLREVIMAVEETKKAGELTIKLGIAPESGMAMVVVSVAVKRPEHPFRPNLFYFDKDGALSKEDPKQLPLKNLNREPAAAPPVVIAPETKSNLVAIPAAKKEG